MSFLQQIFDIYILPEIKRRQESGNLESPFLITQAQVLFCLDNNEPIIRLNSEVKAKGTYKIKKESQAKNKDELTFADIQDISKFELTSDKDRNCGHVTIMNLGDSKWGGTFDFKYNTQIIHKYIAVSKQFLETAKTAKLNKHWNAFIDNCFSTSELLAKSILLIHPDKKFLEKSSHNTIKSKINMYAKKGNISSETTKLFNYLSDLRSKARYLSGDFESKIDSESIIAELQKQLDEVELNMN